MEKEKCKEISKRLAEYLPKAAKGMPCNVIVVYPDGRVEGSLNSSEMITSRYSEVIDKGFCKSLYGIAGDKVSAMILKVKDEGVGEFWYVEGTKDESVEVEIPAEEKATGKQFRFFAFLLSFSYFIARGMWKIGLGLFVITTLLPYWCYFVPSLIVTFYIYETGKVREEYSMGLKVCKPAWVMLSLVSVVLYITVKLMWG